MLSTASSGGIMRTSRPPYLILPSSHLHNLDYYLKKYKNLRVSLVFHHSTISSATNNSNRNVNNNNMNRSILVSHLNTKSYYRHNICECYHFKWIDFYRSVCVWCWPSWPFYRQASRPRPAKNVKFSAQSLEMYWEKDMVCRIFHILKNYPIFDSLVECMFTVIII